MSIIVKICGLTEPATLEAAIEAGADMVGFVFFKKSPRNLSLDEACALGARVGRRSAKVALTVDADDRALTDILAALDPQVLQLHGSEDPARVAAVRARFGRPVMKAIGIAGHEDLARLAAYDDVVDYLLLDAGAPTDAERPGGNGATFDWSLIEGLAPRRPWLLAGGLSAETVGDAVRATKAAGVDVSSGVEIRPGQKDAELVRRFIAEARRAASSS